MTAAVMDRPQTQLDTGHSGFSEVGAQRWFDGRSSADLDCVAEEVAVSLEYNGLAHAVMMATPTDLEDLAVGFSLTEGAVSHGSEILDVEISESAHGIRLAIEVTGRRIHALKEHRRNLAGRTGCGLCGTESLEHVVRAIAPVGSTATFDPAALARALAEMEVAQPLRAMTGATHAAAWIGRDGHMAVLREDVGRHNALDKLIGALARERVDASTGAVLITSRASFEMVQKAAAAGVGVLAAVSAPTGLAVRTAQSLNLALVGFARQGRHVVYAHGWRLLADTQGAPV
jgi:FdhD protein